MPPGKYRLGEIDVVVTPDFKVERAETVGSGYLAGSALDLLRGVENVVRFAQVELQGRQMASESRHNDGNCGSSREIEVGRGKLDPVQWDEYPPTRLNHDSMWGIRPIRF
jgi:hypothetical protein